MLFEGIWFKGVVPVFAKAVCAASFSQESTGEINVLVECGGAEVLPGDLVIGDENGVHVLHPEEAEEVMKKALAKRLHQEKNSQTHERKMEAAGQDPERIEYTICRFSRT